MPLNEALRLELQRIVASDPVVLFMKGTRAAPACGFSATVVRILDELLPKYRTVDVLADPALRDGIKEFSSWPTIPQLYIQGEFKGGCDIVKEMHASGELATALGVTPGKVEPPSITLSPAAKAAFEAAAADAGGDVLRLEIGPRFEYGLFFAQPEKGDVVTTASGLAVHLDPASARRAGGTSIDYVEGPSGAGFKIVNPNEPQRVKQITAAELQAMMKRGDAIEIFDVRTPGERAIASLPGTRLLDQAGQDYLLGLDRGTALVFHCHHGMRSQAAAEHFLGQGFKNVMNLEGGIDAWSTKVDASVPRY